MRWYFDFISPFAYLQSTRLDRFAEHDSVECVPVLFAGLLGHWGNVGPAEIAPKRQWTFKNVTWLAHRDGIPLSLPSQHPFNPLPLLRLSIALNNDLAAVQRLFRFVWQEGHLPQDEDAFQQLLAEYQLTPDALTTPQVKNTLRTNGSRAIADNIFGVPAIEIGDEHFWGYEATDMALASYQKNNWPTEALQAAENLPEGPARNPPAAVSTEPRIPYLPIDLNEPADVVTAIRQRRGGALIELDRLLLYSAPLATGWNHFLGNVRTEFSVSHKLRELAMCTVAVVNRAEYEFSHHAPIYIAAGGSTAKTMALRQPDKAAIDDQFDREEQATIKLATQMTRDVQVDENTFSHCRALFSDQHLVELIATIAAYNMVSRFLVALNVQPH